MDPPLRLDTRLPDQPCPLYSGGQSPNTNQFDSPSRPFIDIGLVGADSRVEGKEKREEKEVKNEEGRLTRMISKLGYRRRHHLSSFRSSSEL